MKANKGKTSDKVVKKQTKVIKKELASTISEKFFDVIKSLGHDTKKITKEIQKTSKQLAKKIARKYTEAKHLVEDKLDLTTEIVKPKRIKKVVSSGIKASGSAVKKVIPKVNKGFVKETLPKSKKPSPVRSSSISAQATELKKKSSTTPKATPKSTVKRASTVSPALSKLPKVKVSSPVIKKTELNNLDSAVDPTSSETI